VLRTLTLTLGVLLVSGCCTTVEQRSPRFASQTCAQLATALDYEKRAERQARRAGVITGIASILETGNDDALLEIDSDMNFFDADERRLSVRAIKLEQSRRCVGPPGEG
jgi:hypothetical protein|tara:strand:- start:8761 stop:9087 length:327 start_codon:yes stop_codon:yes gene_type:complete